jgi:hypothetical protein
MVCCLGSHKLTFTTQNQNSPIERTSISSKETEESRHMSKGKREFHLNQTHKKKKKANSCKEYQIINKKNYLLLEA